jgi:hypothetical protein
MRRETATQTMLVCLGEHAIHVGTLTYSRQGTRENTLFVYDDAWLENDNRFEISPDLPLTRERYFHKAATRSDSVFHFAIADTEPDGWGCKVIARDHARRRKAGQAGESVALTEMDYLLGVDDIGRVGALRFRNAAGEFMRTPQRNEPDCNGLHWPAFDGAGAHNARSLRRNCGFYLLSRSDLLHNRAFDCRSSGTTASIAVIAYVNAGNRSTGRPRRSRARYPAPVLLYLPCRWLRVSGGESETPPSRSCDAPGGSFLHVS